MLDEGLDLCFCYLFVLFGLEADDSDPSASVWFYMKSNYIITNYEEIPANVYANFVYNYYLGIWVRYINDASIFYKPSTCLPNNYIVTLV